MPATIIRFVSGLFCIMLSTLGATSSPLSILGMVSECPGSSVGHPSSLSLESEISDFSRVALPSARYNKKFIMQKTTFMTSHRISSVGRAPGF